MNIPDATKVSKAFRDANPALYGTIHRPENPRSPEPQEQAAGDAPLRPKLERGARNGTVGKAAKKERDSGRFLVRVTSVRRRFLDEDNLCEKYVVDCCRYAGLIPGDGPGQTKIEVTQRKTREDEEDHTLVEIYIIP